MRISDWSSDVCSSDLHDRRGSACRDESAVLPRSGLGTAVRIEVGADAVRLAGDEAALVLRAVGPPVHAATGTGAVVELAAIGSAVGPAHPAQTLVAVVPEPPFSAPTHRPSVAAGNGGS